MIQARVRWTLLSLAALPMLVVPYIIRTYATNFPYLDEWSPFIAGLFVKAHEGNLAIGDFFELHNEHRIVVPRLIFFVLGLLTHWNLYFEMFTTWLVVCCTSVGMLILMLRTFGLSWREIDARVCFMWFVANFVMFTPSEFENWLWGMGLVNVMPLFWLVSCLLVLTSKLRPWFATSLVILLCIASTGTAGNGVLCWPLAGVALAWADSWALVRAKMSRLIAFGTAFVSFALLLYLTFKQPGGAGVGTPPPDVGGGLKGKIDFAFALLGAGYAYVFPTTPSKFSMAAGAVLFFLFLATSAYFIFVWLVRRDAELTWKLLIWQIIGGYSVASALAAASIRATQGISLALSSRYLAYSTALPVALIVLVSLICADLRSRAPGSRWNDLLHQLGLRLPVVLATILLVIQTGAFSPGMDGASGQRSDQTEWKGAVLLINTLPDPNPLQRFAKDTYATLVNEARSLNAMGYLRPPLLESADVTDIIDRSDPTPTSRYKGMLENGDNSVPNTIAFTGWAIDTVYKCPADAVFVTYTNGLGREMIITMGVRINVARMDIAAQEGDDGYRMSAWAARFPTTLLPRFTEKIPITAWAMDSETGRAYKLSGQTVVGRK